MIFLKTTEESHYSGKGNVIFVKHINVNMYVPNYMLK